MATGLPTTAPTDLPTPSTTSSTVDDVNTSANTGKTGGSIIDTLLKHKEVIDCSCSLQSDTTQDAATLESLEALLSLTDVVTRPTLTNTKVGISVVKLRKHPNSKIQSISNRIVNQWKQAISPNPVAPDNSVKPRGNSSGGGSSSSGGNSSTVSSTSSSSTVSSTSSSTVSSTSSSSTSSGNSSGTCSLSGGNSSGASGDTATSSACGGGGGVTSNRTSSPIVGSGEGLFAADPCCPSSPPPPPGEVLSSSSSPGGAAAGVSQDMVYRGPLSGEGVRDKARTFLWKAFIEGVPAEQRAAMNLMETCRLCAKIEESLFEKYGNCTDRQYKNQLKSIKFNLADPKNPGLNLKLYVGSVTPEEVAQMESAEMASDEKKREREKDRQESLEACQADWDLRKMRSREGQFPCGKCKGTTTVYFQMQTRSADEPMTTFVTCLNCGHRFKF
eukprot:GHVS01029466.1.p1 GENE.GHVS01029466.1~~GHVS01029466.1.p1  ORF type:complete len:444 (+),score=123.40 GHVS01029466.1:246-1577(+)